MSTDESMGWEWFWTANGMLALKQNQEGSPFRAEDKEPHLFFEPHELPKLIDDLRQAAADGVQMIQMEILEQAEVLEALSAVSEDETTVPKVGESGKKRWEPGGSGWEVCHEHGKLLHGSSFNTEKRAN